MPVVHAAPPWEAALTGSERLLVHFVIVVTAFTLIAMLARMVMGLREVGPRYRPATQAGVGVVLVASLSYVLLLVELHAGYAPRGGLWVPNGDAVLTWAARYMDWAVSVPLLVVELVAVSAVTGVTASRARGVGVAASVGMVVLGFIGGVLVDGGRSFPALLGFGIASSVCFLVLYGVVVWLALRTIPVLPAAARGRYRAAVVVLLVAWFVYPVVFGLQGFVGGGAWTAGQHVALCVADVTAKVAFGLLLHRVARIRTAADVRAGEDVHPEAVWLDQVRLSAAEPRRTRSGDG